MIKKLILLPLLVIFFFSFTAIAYAAETDWIVETQVGETGEEPPIDPGGGDGDGGTPTGGDGLAAGKFKVPFRCNLNYWSWTYSGHSPWSIDINRGSGSTDRGDAVLASADGSVWDIIKSHGQVAIRHEGGYYTLYVHMQNVRVLEGQKVRQGQKIGEIGDAGSPGSWHLHINHSKGSPYVYANRRQVCFVGYGCNSASVASNTRTRYGTDYNKGC